MAQGYPAGPVRVIVPFPPGGGVDAMGRRVGQKLSEVLGKPVVIDNRAGANGMIGSEAVARSNKDGYTLLVNGANFVTTPLLFSKVSYDPIRDFDPISLMALGPNVLVVHPSLPVKSVKDLIALARSQPGKLSFGTTGSGSAMHLAGELLKMMAGIDMVHVPYKGSGPAASDLAGGQIPLAIVDLTSALPHIRSGRIRAVAVTGASRTVTAPDIPTVAESGVPGFDAIGWFGVVAPAGTPAPIVARLNAEIVDALKLPEVRQRLLAGGAEPATSTPEEFGRLIRSESAKWAKVIKAAGVKLN